jgi:hypothetical protein
MTPIQHAFSPAQRLTHTINLLKVHYPHWAFEEINEENPGKELPSPSLSALLNIQTTSPILSLKVLCPQRILASKTSGMGRPDQNYPGSLWPMQVAMAVAFRLHSFNWPVRMKWPACITYSKKQLGCISCKWTAKGLQTEIHLKLGVAPPSSLALPLPQMIPSVVQSVVNCLESPWPRKILFKTYRNWCDTLQQPGQQDWDGGSGDVMDIDQWGRLLVRTSNGTETLDPMDWNTGR